MSRVIDENDKIPVLLTKRQIELLTEHTFAEDDLLNTLNVSEIAGGKRKVLFTLHDLEDLNGHVAAAANHCSNRKLQQELDSVYDIIQEVELKYDLHY
jgi:hypothetical protein